MMGKIAPPACQRLAEIEKPSFQDDLESLTYTSTSSNDAYGERAFLDEVDIYKC